MKFTTVYNGKKVYAFVVGFSVLYLLLLTSLTYRLIPSLWVAISSFFMVFVLVFLYVSYYYINPVLWFQENHLEFQRIRKKTVPWEQISYIEKQPFRLEYLLKIHTRNGGKPLVFSNKFFPLEKMEEALKEKGFTINE